MFEKAIRQKLRFETSQGFLTVEDLWDLPLTSTRNANLNDLAKGLNRELKATADEDFVNQSKPNESLQLAFDVVKHVIDVRLAEAADARQATDRREKKARLLELIAQKQDESLAGKSIEELTAMVEAL